MCVCVCVCMCGGCGMYVCECVCVDVCVCHKFHLLFHRASLKLGLDKAVYSPLSPKAQQE